MSKTQPKLGPLQRRAFMIESCQRLIDERRQALFDEIYRIGGWDLKIQRLIYESPEISVADEMLHNMRQALDDRYLNLTLNDAFYWTIEKLLKDVE